MSPSKVVQRVVSGASKPGTAEVNPATLDELEIVVGDAVNVTSLAGGNRIQVIISASSDIERTFIRVPRSLASTDSGVFLRTLEPIQPDSVSGGNERKQGAPPPKASTGKKDGDEAPSRMLMERPDTTLSDVAGLDQAKKEIEEKLILPFNHQSAAKKYGVRSGGGVLLYGPPGTGKTHIGRAVAGEIDGGFFYITPSEILDRWVGGSEANVADLFREARAQKMSVIFFDEVEALLPRRDDNSSEVMGRVVPQFLAEMDGLMGDNENILFLGATNKPGSLDPAVLRPGRFDQKIYIPLPDKEARVVLFQSQLKGRPVSKNMSYKELSELSDGFSGADIVEICNRAAIRPFRESIQSGKDRSINISDLKDVMTELEPSVKPGDLKFFNLPDWK
ncbi:AAA family ATPase [Dehalococcoidia bacterium]|nr:AAA family ATPase [Dehalococcoidia bacterium]